MNIEETYIKKTPHEHVLSNPNMYLGSIEADSREMWVYNDTINKIVKKNIEYIPAFYKLFDEIILNARDHSVRDNTCKNIKININVTSGEITVWNDGRGIPLVIHKEYKIYVPEMIFGNLLTSTNYDQTGKTVGGQNGLGAKLVNIYSTKFIVEIVNDKQKYYQEFSNNMYDKTTPVITKTKSNSYTQITYKPDYEKFGMTSLSDDMHQLLQKRAYDLAVCTDLNINVFLNNKHLTCKTFEDYINMYYDKPQNIIYEKFNSRWRVGVIYDNVKGFEHISFVNGIWTYQGGTHVNYITNQIIKAVENHIKIKNKNLKIKTAQIKSKDHK